MVRTSVAARTKAQSRSATVQNAVRGARVPASREEDVKSPAQRRLRKGPGVRLWGYVRRHEDIQDNAAGSELLPQDISLWYDRTHSRFQVISDQKVIDDLAPVEFGQFVRALRFSTTQILFKFENSHDGTTGRPVRVWSTPI
jgi:hypothetical protein